MSQTSSVSDALFAPAVARNKDAVLDVLRRVLPSTGLVLEVASGSGEHVVHFASALPDLRWQPSDHDPIALRSIAAHVRSSGLPNIHPPVPLDVCAEPWPTMRADAVIAINMVHIAPWSATERLMEGAARILTEGGLLYLYGPFRVAGAHTAASNVAFDDNLRARNPAWGVRDSDEVSDAALAQGFRLDERIAMPANNLSLVYRRVGHDNP